jgi:hypothetical protein
MLPTRAALKSVDGNLSIGIDTILEGELQTWMSLLWNVILRS